MAKIGLIWRCGRWGVEREGGRGCFMEEDGKGEGVGVGGSGMKGYDEVVRRIRE